MGILAIVLIGPRIEILIVIRLVAVPMEIRIVIILIVIIQSIAIVGKKSKAWQHLAEIRTQIRCPHMCDVRCLEVLISPLVQACFAAVPINKQRDSALLVAAFAFACQPSKMMSVTMQDCN